LIKKSFSASIGKGYPFRKSARLHPTACRTDFACWGVGRRWHPSNADRAGRRDVPKPSDFLFDTYYATQGDFAKLPQKKNAAIPKKDYNAS